MTTSTEILAAISGNVLLFALVYGMSATVDIDNLREQLGNRNALMTGVFCQFFLLPALGFIVVKAFRLQHTLGIPLLVVTSSPGGSYSNWWCSIFNADLALSVTMTAVSTILSVIFLPLNLALYTRFSFDDDVIGNIDWVALFLSISVVVAAIFLGLLSSYMIRTIVFRRGANILGNVAGVGLMLFSATVANTGEGDSKIWERHWSFYVAVSLPCALGLLIANIIAYVRKLKPAERVTVAIECCYQNVGLSSSLALTMFSGTELNEAMGVPFFFAVSEIVFISTYCLVAWKLGWTKAPKDANLCAVICRSYEVTNQKKQVSSPRSVSSKTNDAVTTLSVDDSSSLDLDQVKTKPAKDGNVEVSV
ncbi:Ileal sodium/bile acid cotransporter [Seminavis robusta]|uniref:Ileal sodium/bile acid cotransporter n=1 Tax=Seminavis robusta TaxID=568900 RepID=A0A9N8D901_9STRA|nr:Ileal sodium/bile acid cotransporter [Seminavis robusta]|eukprot:Sro4_g003710.1 Ileal sodium/bile acid cotransporter (364) ;mRNA; f:226173-227539